MDISETVRTAHLPQSGPPPNSALPLECASVVTSAYSPTLSGICLLGAMFVAILFIAGITATSVATGAFYLLFPELGALAQDTLTRPRGTWSNALLLLVVTPALTAIVGILVVRHCAYGYLSVLLAVGGAVALIKLLRSPIAPAISAALLPVVFAEKSWWYPPAVLLGTTVLAIVCALWKRSPMVLRHSRTVPEHSIRHSPELPQAGYAYLGLGVFLVLAVLCVKLTGLRFLLFPPLAVLGFEMFSRPRTCAWAGRPLLMPLACFLTAGGRALLLEVLGLSPLAAAAGMACGFLVLYVLDVHIPPAMAVALIPLIMTRPTFMFPIAVALGTLLLTICFLLYRRLLKV